MQDIEKQDIVNKLIEKYKLSDQEHYRVYQIIKKYYLSNITSVENPTAVIVGSQPGSGKGSLIGYSKNQFDDTSNVLIITTDDYKPFHPKAAEIAKEYPTYYSAIIEADSAKWTSKILQEAIQNKYNFIFEATFKNDRIIDRMKELKENGFEVIVRGMAVSYIESLLSAFERYEKQVEVRHWGRFFDPIQYNYTYENIPNTLENIENSNFYDALEIYKRGNDIKFPKLVYTNYKKNYKKNNEVDNNENNINTNSLNQFATAKEAIIKCRNEELKNVNDEMEQRLIELENSFKRRNASPEELEGLNTLKEIFNNYKV